MSKLEFQIGPTLQALFDNEIPFSIVARPELGFDWEIGLVSRRTHHEIGNAASLAEAVLDLAEAAIRHYPTSRFARDYGQANAM